MGGDLSVNVTISEQPIDIHAEMESFTSVSGDAGAVATFMGIVRGEGEITCLTLSHFPGFTDTEVADIGTQALKRWPLSGCRINHRVGDMIPGEVIVFVATASKHRRAAFEAVDFIMDYLKSEAPFWKQETRDDTTRWIEPRQEDMTDRQRWEP